MTTQTEQTYPISIDDIALMVNIIGTVSRRGAFEAAEFTIIGGLFEKLKALLPEPVAENGEPAETTNTGADTQDTPPNQLNFDFGVAQDTPQD